MSEQIIPEEIREIVSDVVEKVEDVVEDVKETIDEVKEKLEDSEYFKRNGMLFREFPSLEKTLEILRKE